ncbi:MAG: hypothetical protein AVDCRST_MAG48-2825, partial [uncultured Friedmanniella sp.]
GRMGPEALALARRGPVLARGPGLGRGVRGRADGGVGERPADGLLPGRR